MMSLPYRIVKLDNRYVAKRNFGFEYAVYFKKQFGNNPEYYAFKDLLEHMFEYVGLSISLSRFNSHAQLHSAPWAYDFYHKARNEVFVRNKEDLDRAITFFVLST